MENESRLPTFLNLPGRYSYGAGPKQSGQPPEDFLGHWPIARHDRAIGLRIPVDIFETDAELEIFAELPGADESKLEVTLSGKWLTIQGEKRSGQSEVKRNMRLTERSFGAFSRSLELPFGTAMNEIAASFRGGVLRIAISKTLPAPQAIQRVPVNPGGS